MSFSAIRWALQRRGITHCQRCVLIALADHANSFGLAWPSIDTLAAEAKASRRSVIDALHKLVKLGDIEVQQKANFHTPATYLLVMPRGEEGCRNVTPEPVRGANHGMQGVQIPAEEGCRVCTQTYQEEPTKKENQGTLASLGTRAREGDDAPVIQTQRKEAPDGPPRLAGPAANSHDPHRCGESLRRSDGPPRLAGTAAAPGGDPQNRRPAPRGSRCPADWQPGPALVAFGAAEGLTEPQIRREADRMRDWSLSAAAGRKLDWDRTFRNWLRRAADGQRPRTVVVEKTVTLAPRPLSGRQQAIADIDAALARVGSQRSFLDLPALGSAD